jgi:uncharacterized protein YkwD
MKNLSLIIGIICFATTCSPQLLESARPSNTVRLLSPREISAQESKLIALVNQVRSKKGLHPLETWKTLTEYARKHSQNMANGTVAFGHSGLETRANCIFKIAPCHSVGENVAYTYLVDDPLQVSLKLWIQSPDHYKNIIGDYKETGIGIAYDPEGRCYITQMFSKRRA